MKYLMLVLMVVVVVVAGCASFEASIGAGYRKCPPGFEEPILPDLQSMEAMGLTPEQIALIIKLLGSEEFVKHLFPQDNRVDLGIWSEIRAE